MNLTEVKKSLERQFERELTQGSERNIVFWYYEEGVFADSIDTLVLKNAHRFPYRKTTLRSGFMSGLDMG